MEGLIGTESISNEEDKPLGWGFCAMAPLNSKRAHAMNDWTDKINVKDGNDIHRMEKYCHTKEAEPPKARHFDKTNEKVTRFQSIVDRKVELDCPWS